MYIKSIVIDGFKSYGQRTEVSGFDPAFNAITGLNGSGKSNILDSICFVLGITNLSAVRATNLGELVYKNGQAGITKASVSITFDNSDKNQSPMGYEHHDEVVITRQVVIGGKNKYLINGTNIQANRVHDLFRSVGLNVNNPHFLIMQGRITKVLNMKPPEILSMIEEAAGTMMYESKKQQAQKTIEKKDAKLREINDILNEEITPTLTKLKEERSTYLEYQKIQRELEHLTKLYVAWKFVSAEESSGRLVEELETVEKALTTLRESMEANKEEIANINVKIAELQRLRDEEMGGSLKACEEESKNCERESAKLESRMKNALDSKKREENRRKQIEKGIGGDKKVLEEKQRKMAEMAATYDSLRKEAETAAANLSAAQKRFEAISVGKFESSGGEAETLQSQVIKLKAEMTAATTKIKTGEMKRKHDSAALAKLTQELKKYEKENTNDAGNLEKFESHLQKVENELKRLNYREGSWEEAEEQLRQFSYEVKSLKRRYEDVAARCSWLNFQFSDPEPNFDRSKVLGVAAGLLKVKDPKFCVALDAAGGGKLRNVIVETADVASKLFARGRLTQRVVCLPLDKMKAKTIPDQVLKKAQSLVPNKNMVHRAIDLVEYNNHLESAMSHILGSVLVCQDLNVAKKVAYDESVRCLCVTLDGDKVNPSGEMSGGAALKSGSMLAQVQAVNEAKAQLAVKNDEMAILDVEEKKLRVLADKFSNLKLERDSKSRELDLVKERLKATQGHRLRSDVQELKKGLEDVEQQIVEAKDIFKDREEKHKETEWKIKNADSLKKKELKEAEKSVKDAKKAEETAKNAWANKEAEEDAIKLEIEGLMKAIEEGGAQLKSSDEAIKGSEAEKDNLAEELAESKRKAGEAKEAVKQQKDRLAENNREVANLNGKAEKLAKTNTEIDLELQQKGHSLQKAKTEAENAKETVANMLNHYEWIREERKFFGQPNTAYDFKGGKGPEEVQKRISKLEGQKGKMERNVNMRAMNMLGKAEEQYNDLVRKKTTVENDKAKINKVIEELDVKKRAEIRMAWDKVNKDFGSIFSTLLPGTSAKLQPPDGAKDVVDAGLEVKVAFGDVWKESLAELSGGQRSLVALSLILSLLLFRPAPLYILDEVDAALDLSHTQNIGHMLKTHFKRSQFIVVSLKDGMFNNANVLFRTKFVDGMSTVSRTTQQHNKSYHKK